MSRQHTQTPQPVGHDYEGPQIQNPIGPETPALSSGQSTLDLASVDFDYEASPSVMGDTVKATSLAVMHAQASPQELDPFGTSLRLEFGEDLKEHYQVYLGCLRSCSKVVADLINEAESLRMIYQKADDIKAKLESIIMPELAAESFTDNRTIEAIKLLRTCLKQYPQEDYQLPLVSNLTRYAEKNLYQDPRKMKAPQSKGAAKNKQQPDLPLIERLNHLSGSGVRSLALELYRILRAIAQQEKDKAHKDEVRAAAQGRIILPDEGRRTVSSFVAWVMTNELIYGDVEHFCKVYALSRRLQIHKLEEACIGRVENTMLRALEFAKTEGISLKSMLESSNADQPSPKVNEDFKNVVGTVFTYVLHEKDPPVVLRDLVIHALNAMDDDMRAFELIKENVNKELLLDLYRASKQQQMSWKLAYGATKSEDEPV